MPMKSKLPDCGESIFTTMSALSNVSRAINLSQGFPDFDPGDALREALSRAAFSDLHQYAPMSGLMLLREAIAERMSGYGGYSYHPESEVTVTAGATQAIFTAIQALVHPGDEVIVLEPAYDSYIPAILLSGGIPVLVSLRESDYLFPRKELEAVFSEKTRMLILNTPHNPTGTLLFESDMIWLENQAEKHDFYVLSDEVYADLVFPGFEHYSAALFPKLALRSIIVGSFGKMFHCTGWKVGYAVAPSEMMKEFRKVHQYNVFSVNAPAQQVFSALLRDKDHLRHLGTFFQQKYKVFLDAFSGLPFRFLPSYGTYFVVADYGEYSRISDIEMAKKLTLEAGVATIPLSPFYHGRLRTHRLRFCFAKKEETLLAAASRLGDFFESFR
jgi:methionine aminotransferase